MLLDYETMVYKLTSCHAHLENLHLLASVFIGRSGGMVRRDEVQPRDWLDRERSWTTRLVTTGTVPDRWKSRGIIFIFSRKGVDWGEGWCSIVHSNAGNILNNGKCYKCCLLISVAIIWDNLPDFS